MQDPDDINSPCLWFLGLDAAATFSLIRILSFGERQKGVTKRGRDAEKGKGENSGQMLHTFTWAKGLKAPFLQELRLEEKVFG